MQKCTLMKIDVEGWPICICFQKVLWNWMKFLQLTFVLTFCLEHRLCNAKIMICSIQLKTVFSLIFYYLVVIPVTAITIKHLFCRKINTSFEMYQHLMNIIAWFWFENISRSFSWNFIPQQKPKRTVYLLQCKQVLASI